LSNRIESTKIKNITNGDSVTTINRITLHDEPSDMYNFFSRMPEKLFEITTISGRKIKATPEHPFLVKINGMNGMIKYEMKKVSELTLDDKIIIRHMVLPILDTNKPLVILAKPDILNHYRMQLVEALLLNVPIPTNKLKIIARLLGSLNTDGHLSINNTSDIAYYRSSFYLGEEIDVYQLADDIKELGFGNVSIKRKITNFKDKKNARTTTYKTWEVSKDGAFAYFMSLMGAIVGKKTYAKRELPGWLMNSELSIKREFLSAFQGGDGSRMSYQKNGTNFKPNLGMTFQTTHNDYLTETIVYMNQIKTLFEELKIQCKVSTHSVDDIKTKVEIIFVKSVENLLQYANYINYTYCDEKRRASAPIIEHLKIREFTKSVWQHHIYPEFIQSTNCDNGCISVPIASIT
jgi:hypothetical protein